MAQKGSTTKVGTNTTDPATKDFAANGIEGEKSENGDTEKPAETPAADQGPADESPAETPAADQGPADESPADESPADESPAETPAADQGPAADSVKSSEGTGEIMTRVEGDTLTNDEEPSAEETPVETEAAPEKSFITCEDVLKNLRDKGVKI